VIFSSYFVLAIEIQLTETYINAQKMNSLRSIGGNKMKNLEEESNRFCKNTEKIFQLDDPKIVPENYASFLSEAVEIYGELACQVYGVSSLDEAMDIYKEEMRKMCFDSKMLKAIETYFERNMDHINLNFSAQLQYHKSRKKDKVANKIYRSNIYTEDFFDPYNYGTHIPFNDYQNQLSEIVKTIQKRLDNRFTDRKGYIPDNTLSLGNEHDIRSNISGFEFNLQLESLTLPLEKTDIKLQDYGAVSGITIAGKYFNDLVISPAISIKTDFDIDSFRKLVLKHYSPMHVETIETSIKRDLSLI